MAWSQFPTSSATEEQESSRSSSRGEQQETQSSTNGSSSWFMKWFTDMKCCTQRDRKGQCLAPLAPRNHISPPVQQPQGIHRECTGLSIDEGDTDTPLPSLRGLTRRPSDSSVLDEHNAFNELQEKTVLVVRTASSKLSSTLADAANLAETSSGFPPLFRRADAKGISRENSLQEKKREDITMQTTPQKVPRSLIQHIASVVKKDSIIERQVTEMAPSSLRFQFMKQCRYGNLERCQEIWSSLDDPDRQDFMQAYNVGPKTGDHFFLNFMEPEREWTRVPDSSECASTTASSPRGR